METWQKIVLGVGGVLIVSFLVWGTFFPEVGNKKVQGDGDEGNPDASVVYYYGEGCPHCETVQTFLQENNIVFGENLAKKEIWKNVTNQGEMLDRAKSCGLDEKTVGVPFLFADGECFIGEPKVRGYFEKDLISD
jgi:glutaredoxin